jgi:soluble cytochrome b562
MLGNLKPARREVNRIEGRFSRTVRLGNNARLLRACCVKRNNPTMKKFALPGLAASLVITTLSLPALSLRADDDKPKSPLAIQMQGIAKDFRALRKVVSDPTQKDTALGLVKDMEAHAQKAKDLQPAKTKIIRPADQQQFVADYQKQMDVLIADFGKLEQDVTAGNTADASAMLDRLNQDKRDGHKKFNAEN